MAVRAVTVTAPSTGLPPLIDVWAWLTSRADWFGPDGLLVHTREHLVLSALVVIAAVLIGIPPGLIVGHTGRGATPVSAVANGVRAIPSLGLLTLLIVVISPHVHVTTAIPGVAVRGATPYL